MQHLELFNQHKDLLFSIAYRMLGTIMDTEDILQETFLQWQKTELINIKNVKSYLSTISVRLCINFLNSARVQRNEYVGLWLPEPFETSYRKNMEVMLEMKDSVSMAFMVLLEKLSPLERAVLLLRQVFDFDYSDISTIVGKDIANCRQIMHRAREHISSAKQKYQSDITQQKKLMNSFLSACQAGDMNSLLEVLENDITVWSDGGAKAQAARAPIYKSDKVIKFIHGIINNMPEGMTHKLRELNGQPGLISYVNGKAIYASIFDINAEKIKGIYIIANPDKLVNLAIKK